ncbi:MAG: hypothetical protein O2955_17795 [Planctomycetota bacterium]|nr:hypothetical protein [Planctomycetota bacterium]
MSQHILTADQVYAMLGNASLWETALSCHELLESSHIPHAVVGGVAVCLHGYQRNTVDLDLLVRRGDEEQIKSCFSDANYSWDATNHEFKTPSGVPIQFLYAGDRAGTDSSVYLPDPSDKRALSEREGLPVVSLARLIESKLACGEGNMRRTHKDFADVV